MTQVLHVLEKKLFSVCFKCFFMRKLKGAILSENHRRSQEGGSGVKKSYFNPIFTNIFNKHFSKTNIFFKNFPKQFFYFPKQFFYFPKQFFSKTNIFFQILQKSPSGWGLCPQTPAATGGWGLRPQTPICDTFEYTSFLNTSPMLDIFAF